MNTVSLSSIPLFTFVRRVASALAVSAASGHTVLSTGAWSLPLWSQRLLFSRPDDEDVPERGSSLNAGNSGKEPPKPPKDPPKHELDERYGHSNDIIHQLLRNPVLYDPLRRPRHPIVLCHGLYGFDVRGPSYFPKLQMHYWNNVLAILRKRVGAEVIVTSVPPTGSIVERAHDLDRIMRDKAYGRAVNFMAHSMGGLDCRYLISHLRPEEYTPLSLTSISTPHRGSPFMDWCMENIGIGRQGKIPISMPGDPYAEPPEQPPSSSLPVSQEEKPVSEKSQTSEQTSGLTASLASLPSSLTTFLLSILDSPAYSNLSTSYLNDVFNPATPDDPRVRYFSVAGRAPSVNIWHPFWLPKMVVDAWEADARAKAKAAGLAIADRDAEWGNDGLVSVQSARWGEFLGTVEGCDHWEIRGARGIELDIDIPSLQAVSIAMPAVSLRDWDWTHFLTAWRRDSGAKDGKAEKTEGGALGAKVDVVDKEGHKVATAVSGAKAEGGSGVDSPSTEGLADADSKSASDKLSAVFNWVAENVPTEPITRIVHPVIGGSSGHKDVKPADVEASAQGTNRPGERNELATKEDLERFYVALCRKLYDEGL